MYGFKIFTTSRLDMVCAMLLLLIVVRSPVAQENVTEGVARTKLYSPLTVRHGYGVVRVTRSMEEVEIVGILSPHLINWSFVFSVYL